MQEFETTRGGDKRKKQERGQNGSHLSWGQLSALMSAVVDWFKSTCAHLNQMVFCGEKRGFFFYFNLYFFLEFSVSFYLKMKRRVLPMGQNVEPSQHIY